MIVRPQVLKVGISITKVRKGTKNGRWQWISVVHLLVATSSWKGQLFEKSEVVNASSLGFHRFQLRTESSVKKT